MGYTTEFTGHVTVDPPLNPHEIAYLKRFAESRRMRRDRGPYYIGTGSFGQDHEADITDYNNEPPEQPGLWCNWVPADDGTRIAWDGSEKFYDSEAWMHYLIDTFLRPGAGLQGELASRIPGRYYAPEFEHFTFDHVANGTIDAAGEDPDDRWRLVVTDNAVERVDATITFDQARDSDSATELDRLRAAVARVESLCRSYTPEPPPIFRGPGLSEHGIGYNAGTRDLAEAVLATLRGESAGEGE